MPKGIQSDPELVDLTGQSFCDLTVVSFAGLKIPRGGRSNRRYWNCICKCGNSRVVSTNELREGAAKRCKDCGRQRRLRARSRTTLAIKIENHRNGF